MPPATASAGRDLLSLAQRATTAIEALLSDASVTTMRDGISLGRAGEPVAFDMPLHRDTAYVAVADRDGNMVSFINSLNWTPSSLVAMEPKGPRYSTGASGFGSKHSCEEMPPGR